MDPSEQRPLQACSRCGGSGMLRLGDQSFRTCLDCLGQGRLQPLRPATTTAAVATAAGAPAAGATAAATAAASPAVTTPAVTTASVAAAVVSAGADGLRIQPLASPQSAAECSAPDAAAAA